jgi:hypothetical protein
VQAQSAWKPIRPGEVRSLHAREERFRRDRTLVLLDPADGMGQCTQSLLPTEKSGTGECTTRAKRSRQRLQLKTLLLRQKRVPKWSDYQIV